MNKRIKELALLAGECADSKYKSPSITKKPGLLWEDGHVLWSEHFTAEFAELIIKECMYTGRLAQIDNRLVDAEIKTHFGIKE